jgi:hypothetical protein
MWSYFLNKAQLLYLQANTAGVKPVRINQPIKRGI